MQDSNVMKPVPPNSISVQAYHVCFVRIVILMFFSVMFMSIREQGVGAFEENLFRRKVLIQNFNRLRMKLGDHVFNNVLVGKDGWMELTGNQNLDDYQNVLNFSPKNLQAMAQAIQACYGYAQEHNMTFLIVIAPNKASIYPDKLPDQIQPLSSTSRIDQLNSYLRAHHIPKVLDLRPALRDARQQQDLYYRMGTHWNEYGAYIAYKEIINVLSRDHPDLEPYSEKFFRFRSNPKNAIARGDLGIAQMLHAKHLSLESNLFPTRDIAGLFHKVDFPIPNLPGTRIIPGYHTISWIPNSNLPSLLIFHDSFGIAGLNDFLALNFSKVFYIYRGSSSIFLNRQTIDQFSPDVVIYQVVERQLDTIQFELQGCAER